MSERNFHSFHVDKSEDTKDDLLSAGGYAEQTTGQPGVIFKEEKKTGHASGMH